jgi:DNA polymerase-3 subunit chi
MTEIDFYILTEDSIAARDHFACRLIEKAMGMGRQVVLHVSDENHAESISDYLWSFKPEAFLPHRLANNSETTPQGTETLITWNEPSEQCHDVLINLAEKIPREFSRFRKLSEIVVQQSELLPITRSHFQFYRKRGYPLKSHKIGL